VCQGSDCVPAHSSLVRTFVGSDGKEYKWSFQASSGPQWSVSIRCQKFGWSKKNVLTKWFKCISADNHLVAHYDLKPPNVRAFDVSGNTLTMYERFAHVALGESLALVGSHYVLSDAD